MEQKFTRLNGLFSAEERNDPDHAGQRPYDARDYRQHVCAANTDPYKNQASQNKPQKANQLIGVVFHPVAFCIFLGNI